VETERGTNVGLYLKKYNLIPDVVFAAPLKRTMETARLALNAIANEIPLYEDNSFKEIDYGPDENKTEDEVFMSFHNKTRYNIRVAVKNNVTVSLGNREDLKRFHEIMVETGARDEFVIRTLEYFEKMYDVMAPTDNLRLYLAHYEGKIISGTIALKYGDKVWYLYGASSNDYRNVMPNYLLQWEMIKWAISEKCRIYDFRGVSGNLSPDNPLYGLYRFKKGFMGDFTEFIGDIDFVFDPVMKFLVEKGEPAYRNIRRKVMLRK
jgi:lipid II:glycine glycyltransferase (peptidoglycan interpeptide bridge formation enzyme)